VPVAELVVPAYEGNVKVDYNAGRENREEKGSLQMVFNASLLFTGFDFIFSNSGYISTGIFTCLCKFVSSNLQAKKNA
jgi:hypothetical protein